MDNVKQADSAAKERMQNRLTEYIEKKRNANQQVIEAIEKDSRLIYDYLVPSISMIFLNDSNSKDDVLLSFRLNEKIHGMRLHNNAVGQLAVKYGIPSKYLKDLSKGSEWEKWLAAEILCRHSENAKQTRMLVRAVGDQIRGVMSDSYMRLNSIVLYSTFLAAAKNAGCRVVSAHYNDLSGYIEVIHPEILEIPTEKNGIQYLCFGVQFRNSDFGLSSMEMRAYLFYIVCLNGDVRKSFTREIHRGAKLPDNLELSRKTYELDTQTKASIVNDTVKQIIHPSEIGKYAVQVQESSKINIDLDTEIKMLPQLGVHEYETEALKKIFMENNPENNVQGEMTLFKLAQGLSAVSRDSDPSRKRELDEITGKLYDRVKIKV